MAKQTKKKTAVETARAPFQYCALLPVSVPVLDAGMSPDRLQLIMVNRSKWANGTTLNYYFFDKPTDGAWRGTTAQMDVVRKAFKTWKDIGIGLNFAEVKTREEAQIRIGFKKGDGAWSFVGRDVLEQPVSTRTMNFGWDIAVPDIHNGIGTALHEIGHTLGFPHEHQNPFSGIVWNEEAVYASLAAPPNKWPRQQTFDNILKKLSPTEVNGSDWDPKSVMHYPFEAGLIDKPAPFHDGLNPPGGLSANDIKWAKHFYPPLGAQAGQAAEVMVSYELNLKNSEQKDFTFAPSETKNYTIQTFGRLDTVLVVFEDAEKNKPVYLSGNDDSGTDKNASIMIKLFKGKKYLIKVRVYYKAPGEKAALMIW